MRQPRTEPRNSRNGAARAASTRHTCMIPRACEHPPHFTSSDPQLQAAERPSAAAVLCQSQKYRHISICKQSQGRRRGETRRKRSPGSPPRRPRTCCAPSEAVCCARFVQRMEVGLDGGGVHVLCCFLSLEGLGDARVRACLLLLLLLGRSLVVPGRDAGDSVGERAWVCGHLPPLGRVDRDFCSNGCREE